MYVSLKKFFVRPTIFLRTPSWVFKNEAQIKESTKLLFIPENFKGLLQTVIECVNATSVLQEGFIFKIIA